MRNIGYNSQIDNFVVAGIGGSSQCFATSAWMFLSWYAPDHYKVNDDKGLMQYVEDITASAASDEYEWSRHQYMIQKYLTSAGVKGSVKLGIDLNTGKPTCHIEGLKALLSCGPVIIGTKKMAGLPGGHLILGVDNADTGIICNDPYGNALTGYSDKNGSGVIYPISMFDAQYPDMIRTMWFERA